MPRRRPPLEERTGRNWMSITCGRRESRIVTVSDSDTFALYLGGNWRGGGWTKEDALAAARAWCLGGSVPEMRK